MFNAAGMHVLDVRREGRRLVVTVETDADRAGCGGCGVVATAHGRRRVTAADAPCFGASVLVVWLKRVWRCPESACPAGTWSQAHELVGSRAVLTSRAISWATDALAHDDTTVSALARHLGVDWHTLWRAVKTEATARITRPGRLSSVRTIGVDEHIWRPSTRSAYRAVTAMVDLTRDEQGKLHARLLDVVPGRSGTAYAGWLRAQPAAFVAGIEHAALDPFRGYANAIRDELPDAIAVLDAFHVVKLGTQVVDEVRRREQQSTLHRRGHRDDPLYRIRGLLRHGREPLTASQHARLEAGLQAGDPSWEVSLALLPAAPFRLHRSRSGPGPTDRRSRDQLIPHVSGPRDRPARPDPTVLEAPTAGLLHHQGRVQRRHRGRKPAHREDPPPGPRVPQLHQLPAPHPPRRRRHPPLPATPHPGLDPKSRISSPRAIRSTTVQSPGRGGFASS